MKKLWNENWFVILVFSVLTVFSAKPYFASGIIQTAHDLEFHLLRIEGVKDAILQGNFLPSINTNYLYGYGYAVDVFYPNLLLYIAGIFRVMGFSVITSYKLFMAVITFITFVISFLCMKRMTNSHMIGFITSVLYTMSSYRLTDIYWRGAVGEVLSFIFIPIVVLGIYYLLYKDYKKYYILAFGMAGLLLSHILSAFMMMLVTLIVVILLFKQLLQQKARIYSIVKAGLLTIGICAFFLFPFLEMTVSDAYNFQVNKHYTVANTGLAPFVLFEATLNNSPWRPNIGLLLIILPFLRFFLERNSEQKRLGDTFLLAGIGFLIMTTNLFPWDYLSKTPLDSIQFPWRFLTFSTFCLSFSGAIYLTGLINKEKISGAKICLYIILTVMVLTVAFFKPIENNAPLITAENQNTLNPEVIGSGKEYLPSNVTIEDVESGKDFTITKKDNLYIEDYQKDGTNISFKFNSEQTTEIQLPLIYYKGYTAELITDEGSERLKVYPGKNHFTALEISGTGEINLKYSGTLIQKVSLIITLLTFISLIAHKVFYRYFKKRV